tara:strand:- start:134 stop:628 length:495 start_codon:yes stop_codon:yes gene_type:complete
MPIYFFDTSGLQHRYIKSDHSRGIKKIISDKRNQCLISSITTIEISSAFSTYIRREGIPKNEWYKLQQAFWTDISNGKIIVREPSSNEYEKADQLLKYACLILGRKTSAADALIAATCVEYAREITKKVTFCLDDRPLYSVLTRFKTYTSVLKFKYLATSSKEI